MTFLIVYFVYVVVQSVEPQIAYCVAHAWSSTLMRARREDLELEVGLGYVEVIPYLKKKKYLNAFDLFIYLFYFLFFLS